MISVTITPLERGEHVSVVAVGPQSEIADLAQSIDFGRKYQLHPIVVAEGERDLEVSNMVDLDPIDFDGDLWVFKFRARRADVVRRRPTLP